MIQEIEQKRMENVRLIRNKKRSRLQNMLKTPERVEKEAEQAKWKTSKVFRRAIIDKLYNIESTLGSRGVVFSPGGLSASHQQM